MAKIMLLLFIQCTSTVHGKCKYELRHKKVIIKCFKCGFCIFFIKDISTFLLGSIKIVKVCLEKDPKLVQDKEIELNLIS